MRSSRKTFSRPSRSKNAFELLEAHLKTTDDTAWYAERLELLGAIMFGDLWRSNKSNGDGEQLDISGCEHLDTSPYPLPDRGGEGKPQCSVPTSA